VTDPAVVLRVDSWLWRTRLFKTRAEAATAVTGGRVHVNGARVKSSRPLRIGDRIELSRGTLRLAVTVLAIPDRRGPYAQASGCYREDLRMEPARDQGPAPGPARRPGKRDRERLRQLKGQ
jgi:ribosome-associated heat shock protein Hsp15